MTRKEVKTEILRLIEVAQTEIEKAIEFHEDVLCWEDEFAEGHDAGADFNDHLARIAEDLDSMKYPKFKKSYL